MSYLPISSNVYFTSTALKQKDHHFDKFCVTGKKWSSQNDKFGAARGSSFVSMTIFCFYEG